MAIRSTASYDNSVLRPRILEGMSSGVFADLELIVRTRLNALLCGPGPAVEEMVTRLRARLVPFHSWSPIKGTPSLDVSGALLLEDVAACSRDQQARVLEWITSSPHVQIITTTEWPLYEAVQRDEFLPALYYRLNMIHIDLYAVTSAESLDPRGRG